MRLDPDRATPQNQGMSRLVLLIASFAAATALAQAPARVALVIGNAGYKDAPLANPLNDARDMGKVLEAAGFTVIRRENASLKELHLALREFGDKLGRNSTGLFYFAGHGVQVRGRNYLLPVDADIAREDEVAFNALDLAAVLEKMESARSHTNIVILDACRNNPYPNRFKLSVPGLAQVDAPAGSIIAYATAPGSTAADGAGKNGLYTHYLVDYLGKPGLQIEEVFKAVRAGVRRDSQGKQVPWESTSLETEFFFKPALVMAVAAPPPGPASAKASPKRDVQVAAGAPPNYAVGDSWTYRVKNLLDQGERLATWRVTAITGDRVHYGADSESDLLGNLIRFKRGDLKYRYEPSTMFTLFPLSPGANWKARVVEHVNDSVNDLEAEMRVIGEEDIETPAGRFRAVKVERTSKWKPRNGKPGGVATTTYWYSGAAKRLVASDYLNVSDSGKYLRHERQELESFKVQ